MLFSNNCSLLYYERINNVIFIYRHGRNRMAAVVTQLFLWTAFLALWSNCAGSFVGNMTGNTSENIYRIIVTITEIKCVKFTEGGDRDKLMIWDYNDTKVWPKSEEFKEMSTGVLDLDHDNVTMECDIETYFKGRCAFKLMEHDHEYHDEIGEMIIDLSTPNYPNLQTAKFTNHEGEYELTFHVKMQSNFYNWFGDGRGGSQSFG